MIDAHYKEVKKTLGNKVRLCVVSKNRTKEEIMSYYDAGERIFGENRAKELLNKIDLPHDIAWHFIGHLQRNKVRAILPYVSCIESLDTTALADTIEKEAERIDKEIDVLCEFRMASEDTEKSGHDPRDAEHFVSYCLEKKHLNVKGIMVMGPHTDDQARITEVFRQARTLLDRLQHSHPGLTELSMGMSHDYKQAVQCGSTMVRIGTYLFEEEEL